VRSSQVKRGFHRLAVVVAYLLAGLTLLIGLVIAIQTGEYWQTAQWTIACAVGVAIVGQVAIVVVGWVVAGFAGIVDDVPGEPMNWAIVIRGTLATLVFLAAPAAMVIAVPKVVGFAADWFSVWWQTAYSPYDHYPPPPYYVWAVEGSAGVATVIVIVMLWVLLIAMVDLSLHGLEKLKKKAER
jgi:hypothetical protein